MIKAILLDVDNTLLDFDLCAKQAMTEGFAIANLTYTEELYPTFERINNALWMDIEEGKLTKAQLHNMRWQLIFDALGIDAEGAEFEKLFLTRLSEAAVPIEGALELVEYLHGRYTLCIASNAAYKQQIMRLKKSGIYEYIQHIFISENIGAPKPSAAFFDHCLSTLSPVSKDEVMIIGDSLTADIGGALDYGIKSCFFNRKGIRIRSGADYTVFKLSEIKSFL